MKKYQLTFDIVSTEQEAKNKCDTINSHYTQYMRKNHEAKYYPWQSENKKEQGFICWYYL